MTVPSGGTDAETRQGIAADNAAKAAGVHLVSTSVCSVNPRTGIPHFDSKYEVGKHSTKVGVQATILGARGPHGEPLFHQREARERIYASSLPPTRALAQVAVADIGRRIGRLLEEGTIRSDVATVCPLQDVAQSWKDIAGNLPGVHGVPPSVPGATEARFST